MRVLWAWSERYIHLLHKSEHSEYKIEYIKYMKSSNK